jgi:hypothetical protein
MMLEMDDHRPAIAQAIFPPDQDVSRFDCRISYACSEPLVEAADGDRDMTCALKDVGALSRTNLARRGL